MVSLAAFWLTSSSWADEWSLPAAAADLSSSSVKVRRQAVVELGRLADRRTTTVLTSALDDPDPQVAREAAKALGFVKDSCAVAALIDALDSSDDNLRFYAAYALGEIKDPVAVEPLLACLDDANWAVRDQAAWALRELHSDQAVPRLVERLRQTEVGGRQLVWLLRHSDRELVIQALRPSQQRDSEPARLRMVIALGSLQDPRAAPALIDALHDDSRRCRQAAVEALTELRMESAFAQISRLADHDPESSVRKAAERFLKAMSNADKLLGHWDFEKISQGVVADVTGNGNDGQNIGCREVSGRQGQALHFTAGGFVELGHPAGLPIANRPFTIMAWVKTRADEGVIVARGGAYCGFSLYLKDGTPRIGVHRTQDGPGYVAAGEQMPRDSWVHLAGVVKQDCIELYVNGQLAASTDIAGYLPSNSGQGMEIGFDVANSAAETTVAFEGVIDEVKMFGAALNAKAIAREMAP